MKTILKLIVFLFPAISMGQANVAWNAPLGGVSIALDKFNNNYTVNWDYNPAGDITLTKRNAAGTLIWQSGFNNTDNTRHEVATWVATDPSGNIIVTGTSRSGYSNPVNAASIVMKFDSAGVLLWRNVYENSFDGSSTKKCIVDASGNIYVLGLGIGANGMVTKVKKFSSAGVALWSYFDTHGIGAPLNIKFTPDNKILLTGRSITGSMNGYSKITKGGAHVWSLGGVGSVITGDAAGDAFGNTYLVSGSAPVSGGTVLRKLNGSGVLQWQQTYNSIGAYRVEVGTDNMPVMCGFPNPGNGGAAFLKADQNGVMLWQNLNADGANNFLMHAQLMLDQYNHAYLAAGILTGMGVCKVNNDGTSAWDIVTSGSYSNGFVMGSDYAVYVVGGATARINQAIPCVNPDPLFEDGVTASAGRVNWSFVPGMMQFEVWFKATGATVWKKRFAAGTAKRFNLTNLSCNTTYLWKVRSVCDSTGVDVVSAFSAVDSFTTLACPPRMSDAAEASSVVVEVFPNPVRSTLNVRLEEEGLFQFRVLDVNGRLLVDKQMYAPANAAVEFPVSDIPSGLYVLQIIGGEQFFKARFIKD